MRTLLLATTALIVMLTPALAEEAVSVPSRKSLEARTELNVRSGSDRSILMNEYWVPFFQTSDGVGANSVVYGDLRLMGDDQDNNEFNAGIGYRKMVSAPLLGDGVVGVHGWFDRRHTGRGAKFNQVTTGAEWYGKVIDLKLNAYLPLNKDKTYGAGTTTVSGPYLAGSGIFYDQSNLTVTEEAQPGLDLELGWNLPLEKMGIDFTDTTRVYAGAYHFAGNKTEDVTGWRARIASDISQDVQIGARFQKDDVRGSQGFLEATIRFPFGNKKSYRDHGLYARLDESPERDIDIVTAAAKPASTGPVETKAVLNAESGTAQRVLYVDNSAAGGGDGSKDNPYNTLVDAQAALQDHDVVYVAAGTGDSTNMDQGFTINRTGVQMIGEGSAFIYDGGKFTTPTGNNFSGTILRTAGATPVITNTAGDGMTITGDNTLLSGLMIDGATGNGLHILNAQQTSLLNVSMTGNELGGLLIETTGTDNASLLAQNNVVAGNKGAGIEFKDNSTGSITADFGGGAFNARGENDIFGNIGDQIIADLDGGSIQASNNFWGGGALADISGSDSANINAPAFNTTANCADCVISTSGGFAAQNSAQEASAITSNAVTLSGFTGTRYLKASGDGSVKLIVNGTDVGTLAAVKAGDTVSLRLQSSTIGLTVQNADLAGSGISDNFSSKVRFLPNAIGSLVLWLDASDINGNFNYTDNPADGTAIASWLDKSSSGVTAIQGTAANRPVLDADGLNGLPALYFDGTNDTLTTTVASLNNTPGGSNTVIMAMNWDGKDQAMPIGFNGYDIWFYTNGYGYNTGAGDVWGINSAALVNTPNISSAVFNNGNAKTNQLYLNGVAQTMTQQVGVTGSKNVSDNLVVGNWVAGGPYYFRGTIPEVLIFNATLSSADRAAVESYLAGKYSIP